MFTLVKSSLESRMLHKDFGEKQNFWLDFNCLSIYMFRMLALFPLKLESRALKDRKVTR